VDRCWRYWGYGTGMNTNRHRFFEKSTAEWVIGVSRLTGNGFVHIFSHTIQVHITSPSQNQSKHFEMVVLKNMQYPIHTSQIPYSKSINHKIVPLFLLISRLAIILNPFGLSWPKISYPHMIAVHSLKNNRIRWKCGVWYSCSRIFDDFRGR
jgi:hypothetical protein